MANSTSRKTLRNVEELLANNLIKADDVAALNRVAEHYATAIPPLLLKRITSVDNPIGRQLIPSADELISHPSETSDPIGDDAFTPIPGIVHRYPNRALLKPLLTCPLYCRFCFRRTRVGMASGQLTQAQLDDAYAWLRAHGNVKEVILTGGDPLMLSPRRMEEIIAALSAIEHIETIRIHTRVPIATPERVTTQLINALETDRALWVVVHVNHASEISPEARRAFRLIQKSGTPVLSQSVLLRGVNDTLDSLVSLFQSLIAARIKPYYLHQLDHAPGTSHFYVPIAKAQQLLRDLRGKISGLAWPLYVIDIPGGYGKVPIAPNHHESSNETDTVIDGQGRIHRLEV